MSESRVKVAMASEIPPGEVRVFGNVALFNVEGRFYAIDNACMHRGGPLGEGELEGTVVRCPWHAWRWDVTTGANVNNPAVKMPCFAVTVEDGAVFVDLGSRAS